MPCTTGHNQQYGTPQDLFVLLVETLAREECEGQLQFVCWLTC